MNIGVIRFPGTNNEYETVRALESFGVDAEIVDHKEIDKIGHFDGYWIAGGFSYADVLRAGAIAAKSEMVERIASSGKVTIGVCNGFQIMTEANLLPGALLPNTSTRFVCKWINLLVTDESMFSEYTGKVLRIPIAHFEGNLYSSDTANLNDFLKYSDENGTVDLASNPNGSIDNIAGLISESNQYIGMMPHPERASFKHQGSQDGRIVIERFLEEVKK